VSSDDFYMQPYSYYILYKALLLIILCTLYKCTCSWVRNEVTVGISYELRVTRQQKKMTKKKRTFFSYFKISRL
jgi:hypothetical protein